MKLKAPVVIPESEIFGSDAFLINSGTSLD